MESIKLRIFFYEWFFCWYHNDMSTMSNLVKKELSDNSRHVQVVMLSKMTRANDLSHQIIGYSIA